MVSLVRLALCASLFSLSLAAGSAHAKVPARSIRAEAHVLHRTLRMHHATVPARSQSFWAKQLRAKVSTFEHARGRSPSRTELSGMARSLKRQATR